MDLLLWIIISIAKAIARSRRERRGLPVSDEDPFTAAAHEVFGGRRRGARRPSLQGEPELAQWLPEAQQQLAQIITSAHRLADQARLERATHRFVEPLEEYLIRECQRLSAQPSHYHEMRRAIATLGSVGWQIEQLLAQHRHAQLGPMLGDADKLAQACYTPLMEFSRARRIQLTSLDVVSHYNVNGQLGTMVGFIPTGLAPLELPPQFFERVVWWPAIAHEIAHDWFAAAASISEGLRDELDLVSEQQGCQMMVWRENKLSEEQLDQLLSAWFEELFCDVVGTLMLGPAYAWSMVALFARPDAVEHVSTVAVKAGGIDPHPPRHLRVLVTAHILDLVGAHHQSHEVLKHWRQRHRGSPQTIAVPMSVGRQLSWVKLAAGPIVEAVIELADMLFSEPFEALAGTELARIPGLEYGPHGSGETTRIADEILAQRPVHHANPRWIIAGAVMAYHRQPHREQEIMQRVRAAITAVGTFEQAPDAYQSERPTTTGPRLTQLREAFLLHTILAPPPALRRGRRAGLLDSPLLR